MLKINMQDIETSSDAGNHTTKTTTIANSKMYQDIRNMETQKEVMTQALSAMQKMFCGNHEDCCFLDTYLLRGASILALKNNASCLVIASMYCPILQELMQVAEFKRKLVPQQSLRVWSKSDDHVIDVHVFACTFAMMRSKTELSKHLSKLQDFVHSFVMTNDSLLFKIQKVVNRAMSDSTMKVLESMISQHKVSQTSESSNTEVETSNHKHNRQDCNYDTYSTYDKETPLWMHCENLQGVCIIKPDRHVCTYEREQTGFDENVTYAVSRDSCAFKYLMEAKLSFADSHIVIVNARHFCTAYVYHFLKLEIAQKTSTQ